jgi:hypothetical protein
MGLSFIITSLPHTLDHSILLKKLYWYGLTGPAHSWLSSYLANGKQYEQIGKTNSTATNIQNGVPQGSILGPLLFILYNSVHE